MSVSFASDVFPCNADVKERSGLPWGCMIQPFGAQPASPSTVPLSQVARCGNCMAYLNSSVRFHRHTWQCPLCRRNNKLSPRYMNVRDRAELDEVRFSTVDVLVDDGQQMQAFEDLDRQTGHTDDNTDEDELMERYEARLGVRVHDYPLYLFLVDVSGGQAWIDLISSALLAAMEAVEPDAWISLVTFSDRIGVYDLRSSVPHVKYTRIPRHGAPALAIFDVLPYDKFFTRASECKSNFVAAVEALQSLHDLDASLSSTSSSSSAAADEKVSSGRPPKRGYGAALASVVEYLSNSTHGFGRVLSFLSGLPNYGDGALAARHTGQAHPDSLVHVQSKFFVEQGNKASQAGLCLDVYAVSAGPEQYLDLASLRYLCILTGGNLLYYETLKASEASLPQDVYRQLQLPQAYGCLLRVRCSSQFRVSSIYGHLTQDEHFEDMFQIAGCDPKKTLSLDFEFTGSTGFPSYSEAKPVVQVAFRYTSLERRPKRYIFPTKANRQHRMNGKDSNGSVDDEKTEEDDEEEMVVVPVQRLRLMTYRLKVTNKAQDVHNGAHPEVVAGLLTQQLIQQTIETGVAETRELLRDWMINLAVLYNRRVVRGVAASGIADRVDVAFVNCDRLQLIPKFVYGMLRSPLLEIDVAPDTRTYYHCLLSALHPQAMATLFYPQMSAWSDFETESAQNLPLSRSSVSPSVGHVYLVNAFTQIVLFLLATPSEQPDLPFPPATSTAIRKFAKRLKSEAVLVSPQMAYCRAGSGGGGGGTNNDSAVFDALLLEDADPKGFSYRFFMDIVLKESIDILKKGV